MNYHTLLVVVIHASASKRCEGSEVSADTNWWRIPIWNHNVFTNLPKILTPYESIFKKQEKFTTELICLRKIEILADQLNEHGINEEFKHIEKQEKIPFYRIFKRSINFLDSTLKFITGIPDNYDLIAIEEKINQLINNNEMQHQINLRFEKLIESLGARTVKNHLMIQQTWSTSTLGKNYKRRRK